MKAPVDALREVVEAAGAEGFDDKDAEFAAQQLAQEHGIRLVDEDELFAISCTADAARLYFENPASPNTRRLMQMALDRLRDRGWWT